MTGGAVLTPIVVLAFLLPHDNDSRHGRVMLLVGSVLMLLVAAMVYGLWIMDYGLWIMDFTRTDSSQPV